MPSKIRSTALPALAFAVSLGLLGLGGPAEAKTAPAPSKAAASSSALAERQSAPAPLAAKPRVNPPAKVAVHEFEQGKMTITWTHVRGVGRYQVHAYKTDPKSKFTYPFNIVQGSESLITTKRLSFTFVNNFSPWKDAKRLQALPWVITVTAKTPNSAHRDSSPKAPTIKIHDKTVTKVIYITKKATAKQKKSWKKSVAKCAAVGLAAGMGTVGTGGALALAATWIPGVGEVSWAAVLVAAASSTVTSALGCILVDKVTGDVTLVSPSTVSV